MKKFLLSCFILAGLSANAQITVNEGFEGSTIPAGFTSTGGYSDVNGSTNGLYTLPGGCEGAQALGTNMFGGSVGGRTMTVTYTANPSVSNGKKIDYSFNWQTIPYSATSGVTGSIAVSYSRAATGTAWTTLGTATVINGQTTGCPVISGTIAESTSATTGVPANSPFRFRIVVTTTSNTTTQNDFFVFLDAFKLTQETTVAPACAITTLPANSANPNNDNLVSWPSVPGASAYKVYVGTTAGGNEIVNGTSVSASNYSLAGLLTANSTYFVKVVPTNANGDATGCTEGSFTTGAADYCSVKTTANNTADYVSNVTYEGISSNSAAGSTSYSNFTAQKAVVKREQSKTLSVTIVADPQYPQDHIGAFIDWNQDLIFSANEYVNLAQLVGSGTYTANIAVPADAVLGDTRMRIFLDYSTNPAYVQSACNTTFSYGEVEDYTVTVEEAVLAVNDVNKAQVSVYPNPFTDVLKISDVKGVKSISISDVSGRQVKTLAPSVQLNVSSLKAGLYIVNLHMEDGSVKSIKAIKK